jgi:glycogen synthase
MTARVLIYSHTFAPKIGGVETYVMLLAEGLALQSDGPGEPAVVVTVATPTPSGEMDDRPLPFQVIRQPSLATLAGLVHKADVIHLAGPCLLPMFLGLVLRKRVVVEHHGYQAVCPNGLLLYEPTKAVCPGHFMARGYNKCLECNAATMGWVKSALELLLAFPRRWASKRVASNLPITNHVNTRVRLPRSKVIYYGISDSLNGARSAPKRVVESSARTAVTYAYVGRLVSEKGLHLLVEAARRLHEADCTFRLKFIGDGSERPRLEERVEALGMRQRVTFTGYLQGEALESALRDVTAMVMPSIWEETAGLSAMEHMMRGRLLIAADIGGLGEVVDGAALKFTAGDAASLTSCLQRVLDDPGLAQTVGKKARERALRLFSRQRMITAHLCLYRDLMGEPNLSGIFVGEQG